MEGCKLLHHLFVEIWLVCVHSLGMLAEIVEARELLRTMALEGAFASMLSNGRNEYKEGLLRVEREREGAGGRSLIGSIQLVNRENGQACIWVPHYGMRTRLAGNVQDCTRLQARALEGAIFILFPQA